MSLDETNNGGSQIPFWDGKDGDRELAVVTGTSGVAISSAEQRNNRKGKTSDPCDFGRSSCGTVFLSPPGEDAGYTGGLIKEPTSRFRRRVVGGRGRESLGGGST